MGELRVEHLKKHFEMKQGWNGRRTLKVFEDISFTIRDGEFVSVIGSSGCGKTTVLNLVSGLEKPTGGRIEVDGKRVVAPGLDRGIVFQEFALFPWLTAAGNIAFGLRSQGIPRKEREERIRKYIELVGLSNFQDYYPSRLSGGMRQRVGLGRALAIEPSILLMDEPFGSLDAQTRESMQNALSEIWIRARKTVLFITHDIREAVFLSDRVLVLTGRPSELSMQLDVDLQRPRRRRTAEFQRYEEMLENAIFGQPPNSDAGQG